MLIIDVSFEPTRTDFHKGDAGTVIGIHIGMNLEDKTAEGLLEWLHHPLFRHHRPRRGCNLHEAIEQFLGPKRFVWLYLASIIGGSIAFTVFDPMGIAVGASGGIFGLMGAYFVIIRALGYRSLSLSAIAHGPVKAMILDLDAGKAAAMMTKLLNAPAGSVSIRQKLTEFAEAEGLSL